MFEMVRILADVLVGRVAALREQEHRDLGASALEWAVIAAIAVVMSVVIGGIVYHVVTTRGQKVTDCGNAPVDATNC